MKDKQTSFLIVFALAVVALAGCGNKAETTAPVTPQKAEAMKADQINKYKRMQEQGRNAPTAPR